MFMAPKIKFLASIRATPTPKMEEDGKGFARIAFEFVNHEADILARN